MLLLCEVKFQAVNLSNDLSVLFRFPVINEAAAFIKYLWLLSCFENDVESTHKLQLHVKMVYTITKSMRAL